MKRTQFATVASLLAAAGGLAAAPLKSAVVSTVVNDVRVSESSSEARSASVGQKLGGSSTLLTGRASRAELSFQDKTVTRIGANSVFRFSSGTRDMSVTKGSFLLQVPKNAGGAKIRTSTVTAAITGTTIMMEFNPGQWLKFICLEGNATLTNQNGDTIVIPAGQMLVMHPDAQHFPALLTININKIMKTSNLMDENEFGELDRAALEAIAATIAAQLDQRRTGALLPGGPLRHGSDPDANGQNGGDVRTILPKPPLRFENPERPPIDTGKPPIESL